MNIDSLALTCQGGNNMLCQSVSSASALALDYICMGEGAGSYIVVQASAKFDICYNGVTAKQSHIDTSVKK